MPNSSQQLYLLTKIKVVLFPNFLLCIYCHIYWPHFYSLPDWCNLSALFHHSDFSITYFLKLLLDWIFFFFFQTIIFIVCLFQSYFLFSPLSHALCSSTKVVNCHIGLANYLCQTLVRISR